TLQPTSTIQTVTPTATRTLSSSSPTATPRPLEPRDVWTIIIGSDCSLPAAQDEVRKDTSKQLGYTPIEIYKNTTTNAVRGCQAPPYYYTSIGNFNNQEDADRAARAINPNLQWGYAVIDLLNWCPKPVQMGGYYDCDTM